MTDENNGDEMLLRISAVEDERRRVLDASRADAIARQHALGKLTARERITRLLDGQSFRELGALVLSDEDGANDRSVAPGDGIVVGDGLVDGRVAGVVATDFTALGGSNGKAGALKMARQTQLCVDHGYPLVMLLDGGGHRIQEGLDSRHFAGADDFFLRLVQLSGWAPIVSAVLGPGFAGPANLTSLSDFVVMVRGTSSLGVAGPALVKAGTGVDIDKEELGGADAQATNGIIDCVVDSEDEAVDAVRQFLSYFPSNASLPTPRAEPVAAPDADLVSIVPTNPRRAYDVRRVIEAVADAESVLELRPSHAKNIVTSLVRIDGRTVGVIANQPMVAAGAITAPACDKAAHFVSMCDAFGVPLLYLIDTPGFLIGPDAERSGLVRRSGKLLFELGRATVPRFTVVLRKAYGLGYVAMGGGRSFHADLAVAWPTAEICAMSVPGAVDVAFRREVESADDPDKRRQELIDEFAARTGPLAAAEGFGIDDLVDPRDTRAVLVQALDRTAPRRRADDPPRFHPVTPI
jgi:acetyl-CoA carboxylase carboxyltransferase component